MTQRITSWRKPHGIIPQFEKNDDDKIVIPATRFFDQMAVIGDEVVACFVLDTAEGYVLLDCMEPTDRALHMIEQGFKDLGYDINELTAILITHGHGDHYGNADILQQRYGARVFIGKRDHQLAVENEDGLPYRLPTFNVTRYLEDGDVLTFGDTAITCIETPGHTPGCFSFIVNVSDEGAPHTVALWGGSGVMPTSDPQVYYQSLLTFSRICDENGVDGEIATHPSLDNGLERYALVRNIVDGVPNPFVLGSAGYHYYEQQFYELAYQRGIPRP